MSKLKKVPALMAAARDAKRTPGKGERTQFVEITACGETGHGYVL
jgi:hypothetical protein